MEKLQNTLCDNQDNFVCVVEINDNDNDNMEEKEILLIELCDDEDLEKELCEGNEFIKKLLEKSRNIPDIINSVNKLNIIVKYLEEIQKEILDYINKKSIFDISKEELNVIDSIGDGIDLFIRQANNEVKNLIKTAGHHSPERFYYVVTPFVYGICRIIANSYVKYNKNIADIIKYLDEKFKFTDREKVEIYFLLKDMGYYIQHSVLDGVDLTMIPHK